MKMLLIFLVLLTRFLNVQASNQGETNMLPTTVSKPYISTQILKQHIAILKFDSLYSVSKNICLQNDTIKKPPLNFDKLTAKKVAIPVALIAVGFVMMGKKPIISMNAEIQEEIQEHYPRFNTKIDNYTRHVPIVAAYGLNLAGIKGKHGYFNLTGIFVLSDFLNSAVTNKLKTYTHQLRPDYSTYDAFPSGHTSGAFSAATILFLEYKDQSIWYGVGGYGFATATGLLRLLNNKHWVSDIIAGAGVGILTAQASYAIYPWLLKKLNQEFPRIGLNKQMVITPMYANGSAGLGFVCIF